MLVVLLAVFAVAPLEYPGAIQSQTGLLPTYNLINLDQAPLQIFNWAPTVGRAYDLFRTDGAMAYLPAELFHLIGIGFLDATKLVIALAWIASGLAMYALARRFLGKPGALLASAVYVYLPFHIATVYVRGAFAESIAWAIFPIALLSIVNFRMPIDNSKRFRSIAYSALPTALLFLVQPGIAILFALVSLAIAVGLNARHGSLADWRDGFLPVLAGLTLGVLLYIPTIARYGATILQDGFSPNYVYPFQLFSAMWGFGTSSGSFLDQFPLQVGVVPIGLTIIAVALAWDSTNQSSRRVVLFLTGLGMILAILTLEIAVPLWSLLGAFATYPWQLLAFVGFALALVAGSAIEFDARLSSPAMLAFFVALPVVASYSYLAPRYIDNIAPTRPTIAIFGRNEIALLDYRIVGPLQHGATVRVNTIWQALRPIDHDYTVFVHAVDANGKTWAQLDTKPQQGSLPTLKWQPGQVVTDTYTIQIDLDGPREGYQLEFGLYVEATGIRLILINNSSSTSSYSCSNKFGNNRFISLTSASVTRELYFG